MPMIIRWPIATSNQAQIEHLAALTARFGFLFTEWPSSPHAAFRLPKRVKWDQPYGHWSVGHEFPYGEHTTIVSNAPARFYRSEDLNFTHWYMWRRQKLYSFHIRGQRITITRFSEKMRSNLLYRMRDSEDSELISFVSQNPLDSTLVTS